MSEKNLVIVESPAKAKTIEKFLGKEFVVKSSFGHIRDLSKKNLGIDIDHGFTPTYEIPDEKKRVVGELAKAAKGATVWLASDEDREGEAIAWHLAQVLGLNVENTKRIVFHEITKPAILDAVEHPRTLDMRLVNAQQARRILDRIVGFELSPVLWKKVRPSLSAGRVQSVAVRLLVEREREILAFQATPYWRVVAHFYLPDDPAKVIFKAELNKRFETLQQSEEFLHRCMGATYRVAKSEQKPATKSPAPPFTTSTLQQEAGRKLSMSVAQTMVAAQHLYEAGYITYMRTDSVNLSKQAIAAAKEEVVKLFGERYSHPRNYTTKTKGAQEAHEAIRPSYMDRHTINAAPAEKRLYELIHKRTLASQMAPADLLRTVAHIELSNGPEQFVATGEVIRFDGFLKLYTESHDDQPEEEQEGTMPAMKPGDELLPEQITATERFTAPPPRYSEAALVRRLEELGIGRPSTYAPTITTIINRGYVVKQSREGVRRGYIQLTLVQNGISSERRSENVGRESARLSPTDTGIVVNDYLEAQFPEIMDYHFTAKVELDFDAIAEGTEQWQQMLGAFYGPFHRTVEQALEQQAEYPNQERVLGIDPRTGGQVSARIGRFGPMVQLQVPDEEKPRYASLRPGQLIVSLTLEEALELFALPRTVGEYQGEDVVIGISKFGPYVRHNGEFASLDRKEDPFAVTLERAIELIEAKRSGADKTKNVLRSFDEEPDTQIIKGKYGPYITSGGKNYRIPKDADPEALTLEQVREIIAKDTKDGPKKSFRKK